jgi:hypothetical protein
MKVWLIAAGMVAFATTAAQAQYLRDRVKFAEPWRQRLHPQQRHLRAASRGHEPE